MWLVYALLAPIFFAIVHVLDSHCVDEIFEKPWMGVVTSSIASLIVFVPLPYLAPLISWEIPRWEIMALAIIAGGLIQISQAFYFQSLAFAEAGVVASYWNFIPAFLPIMSFLFLGQTLTTMQYAGIAILIMASTYMLRFDIHNTKTKKFALFLMIFAAFIQALAYMLQGIVFLEVDYYFGFLLMTCGLIIVGILPLFFSPIRRIFTKNLIRLSPSIKLFLLIEFANLIALALAQKAIDLGVPSLVAAVETTIPAFTFLVGLILYKLLPKYGDSKAIQNLIPKIGIVGVMVIGVWMVT